jgi:hypothetical protein
MRRGMWFFGASGLAVLVALACSGKTADVGDGGASSSGGSSSGGSSSGGSSSGGSSSGGSSSGGLVAGCPAALPAARSSCTKVGLECEYGTDLDLACNAVARCDATGWQIVPNTTSHPCPTPPNGGSCPATFASVSQGSTCTAPPSTSCWYPEGDCTCEVYCGSQYPVGHECDAGTPTTWVCNATGEASCPSVRPHLGTACSTEGQTCSYGDCTSPTVQCTSGSWRQLQVGCPISSRRFKDDVAYLGDDDEKALASRTLSTRLATYRYKSDDPSRHLGFVIEDDPTSPAVIQGKDRVDLYGYTSMAVATLHVQAREIAELKRQVAELRRDLDDAKKTCR